MKKTLILAFTLLAGCSTQASRMAECQANGVSRDTCYLAEQNRQSSITAAAEKQALENAAKQYAQAAKKVTPFVKHVGDIEIKRDKLGIVSIDGKPAAPVEQTPDASSYEAGLFTAILYKNGKVALMENGRFAGFAK
nr:hypothetical protein [uncultured Enterobacter sp.]